MNFGLTRTPDSSKANMRAYMWDRMKGWLLTGGVETAEEVAIPRHATVTGHR